ncbi:MAG TPA: hypothetical protein VF909_05170 [Roseiflexaceae bacterium]
MLYNNTAMGVPKWRQARCVLCLGPLLVRDDNEQVVCSACGARLEVLPTTMETRVRHAGEALDSVRDTLDPAAVERSLMRLRERLAAHQEALGPDIRTAQIKRGMSVIGALMSIAGAVLAIQGHGGLSALLFFVGLFLMLGGFGLRWGAFSQAESQQRQRERNALRQRQALAREISRRERFLAEANSASPSEARS